MSNLVKGLEQVKEKLEKVPETYGLANKIGAILDAAAYLACKMLEEEIEREKK